MGIATPTTWIPAWLRPAPDSMAVRMRRAGYRPKLQAFNLLWSFWVFCTPAFAPVGWPFVWSLVISYPIFLLLFALVHVRPYTETRYYAAAMLLLACFSMPFNAAAWSYGVFACIYVPYLGTLASSITQIVLYELLLMAGMWWLGWPWFVVLIMIGVCSSAGFGSLIGKINAVKNFSERVSMDEVRRLAANAERERIGRDLHDLLGHTLSLITLKLELSNKLFDRDPERARRELGEAEKVARHALAEVRAAVTGIRTTGLAGELASARLMLRTAGVALDVGAIAPLPDKVDETLALVLREAVTNIHRHAQASHASVDVELAAGHARMRIRDDGRGGVGAAGNGLKGMRERVEAMHGTLLIHSLPGAGTELAIDVPLPARDAPPEPSILSYAEARHLKAVAFNRHGGEHP